MSDRAFLFLFSLAVVTAGLVAGGWLIATDQVGTVDGLFLFCSCVVIAFVFGLYLRWMVRSAMSAHLPSSRTDAERSDRRTTPNAKATAVLSNVH
jgi:hypothetical protein